MKMPSQWCRHGSAKTPSRYAPPRASQMEVGRIEGGNVAWSRAHFGAWCVVSAPLILGLDVTDQAAVESIVPYVTNEEAIAINQQWAGHPGRLVSQIATNGSALPIQVWVKPQPAGKLAVYIVNPTPTTDVGAPDPLGCFTELPAAKKENNVCFGQYKTQFPAITSPSECATQCLQDAACTQFVWAVPSEGGARCRVSHTCTKPTSFLAGFDGYMRTPTVAGCGAQPKPPPSPVAVAVNFTTLGLGAGVTGAAIRDVWARKDLGDTTGASLDVTVAPMDSVFVVLTPK